MLQGHCNTTATIEKIINNLFEVELEIYVHFYIDDIVRFSKIYKKHLSDVRTVVQRINYHEVYVSSNESQSLTDVVSVIEQIIPTRCICNLPLTVTKI